MSVSEHLEQQRSHTDAYLSRGPRPHTFSTDPFTRYIFEWRAVTAIRRLQEYVGGLDRDTSFLVLCAAEGHEGSILCNLGFHKVTVSDISPVALQWAAKRDPRLRTQLLLAEKLDLPDRAFDVVFVQDGLHHLRSPIQGFTEMLRVSRCAAIFLEPHDSLVGRTIGTKWERNADAVNYVFRWSRRLVEGVASSFMGPNSFENLSFSFWHHTAQFARLGKLLGGRTLATVAFRSLKFTLDVTLRPFGNQFCGMVVKKSNSG
jgi:SAM-dependent methyltransferase